MSWTTPTIRATGYLVTASDWNTDLVNNLAFLKGEAGENIDFEDDIIPSAGTEKVGLSTDPWAEGHFEKLFAGPRCALHKYIREIVVEWNDDAFGNYQLDDNSSGGGAVQMGGFNQCVLEVTNNLASVARFDQLGEQNNALENDFNASRSPYYRQEFAIDGNVSDTGIFMGLRQTPGDALPVSAAEHAFGLVWTGAIWQFQSMNASTVDASGSQSISVDTRYVFEMLLISGTSVECYLNGVLIDTLTVVPTGALKWSCLFESDGGGGATTKHLTLGKAILQEDLS